jgi:formate hydrogenlyase subunit 4
MSSVAAGALQLAGVAIAPLAPGTIQALKARMQGRRGASPLQPYRVLGRLWRKSAVDPLGAGPVYRLAPAIAAASLLLAFALVPSAGRSGHWGLGNDALVFVGLLALARFALAAAAWDPGNGFALIAALPAHSTDLVAMTRAAGGWAVWSHAAHWCGAVAFALVVLVETGRQPIDNPDTHLELTMIHEGPLLEYAGRDLAYLTWVAAARHWLILMLAGGLFLPHPRGFAGSLAALAAGLLAACLALALSETTLAKMRILRAPPLLGLGCVVALVGVASWIAG